MGAALRGSGVNTPVIASARLLIIEMHLHPGHSEVFSRFVSPCAKRLQWISAGVRDLEPLTRSALDPAGLGRVCFGGRDQICATGPSDARKPEQLPSAQPLIHRGHARAPGTDLAEALSQQARPLLNPETSVNIPLT